MFQDDSSVQILEESYLGRENIVQATPQKTIPIEGSHPTDLAIIRETLCVTSLVNHGVKIIDTSSIKIANIRAEKGSFFNPRYVTTLVDHFLVLDDNGFNLVTKDGAPRQTFLKSEGHKYRGLAHYKCHKETGRSFVTLDISDPKKQTYICTFNIQRDKPSRTFTIKEISRILLPGSSDKKLRFLATIDNCNDHKDSDHSHQAFINGLWSLDVIVVQDFIKGTNSELKLWELAGKRKQSFYLGQGAGIVVTKDFIFVVDRFSDSIEQHDHTGKHLLTYRFHEKPLAITSSPNGEELWVTLPEAKQVVKIQVDFNSTEQ